MMQAGAAAAYTGIGTTTLAALVDRGVLRRHKLPTSKGQHRWFRRVELDAWLAQGCPDKPFEVWWELARRQAIRDSRLV